MMTTILLLCIAALLLIHRSSLKTLTTENLNKLQISMDRYCGELSKKMFSSYWIPGAIEETNCYISIRDDTDGILDREHYPYLYILKNKLGNQYYNQDQCDMYAMYLHKQNSIVMTNWVSPDANTFFSKNMVFQQTDADTLLSLLSENKQEMQLLPMQHVVTNISGKSEGPYLIHITNPRSSDISILSLYSESSLLNHLGYPCLPDGSYIELRANDGQVLMSYPGPADDNVQASWHVLQSSLDGLGIDVTVRIPQNSFAKMLYPAKKTAALVILGVILLGFALAILLSRISVIPIHKLIARHGSQCTQPHSNEVRYLDQILISAQERNQQMHVQLVRQILGRALSGIVLSEHDEMQLAESFDHLAAKYRVAIFHMQQNHINYLQDKLTNALANAACVILTDKEIGLLFTGSEKELQVLSQLIETMNEHATDIKIMCGVSSETFGISNIHKAVRQARFSLPNENGMKLFSSKQENSPAISRLQQERLNQSILSNNEADSIRLLHIIADSTTSENVKETFYSIQFILRCAAEEMELQLSTLMNLDYSQNLLPDENIRALESIIHDLFAQIKKKNDECKRDEQSLILAYIQEHTCEYGFSATDIAEHFNIPLHHVYEKIKIWTGMSVGEYITSLRMKRASELLYSTLTDVAEIAGLCGYQTPSTFYRQFKAAYGVSPGQFRSQNQKQSQKE